MKQKILLFTNFSDSARNALAYASQLFDLDRYDFLLVHIYTLPLPYTVEGVALASISEALRDVEEQLNDELDWVRQQFPQIDITGRYILGGLIESSRQTIAEQSPELIIFGTAGYYAEVWHTDSELLLALRNLPVPVMIVPQHISFHPIKEIGFACDYKNVCVPKQIDFVNNLISITKARLHVVHVTRSKKEDAAVKQENEASLQLQLSAIQPLYYSIENPEVFRALDNFINTYHLDLLMVIPRRHEFWQNLFHKSNIRQLAFLNRLPILALPE